MRQNTAAKKPPVRFLLDLEEGHCDFCSRRNSSLLYEAQDLIYKTDPRSFSVVRCLGCNFVYLTPRPTPEDLVRSYPDDYFWSIANEEMPERASFHEILMAHYFRRLSARRASWVHRQAGKWKGAKVLDVGCGRGGFLKAMEKKGYERLYGVDLSYERIDDLKKEAPHFHVTQGDFSRFDDPWETTFDIITLWHVLEHLHSPTQALRTIVRLLKPGGLLVIGTQNFDSLSRRLMGKKWPLNDVPRHLHHFTRESLKGFLTKSNLRWEKEWRLTESFPVLGGHLLAHRLMKPNHRLKPIPALAACLALSPIEFVSSLFGKGCLLTVAARKM